MRVIVHAEDLSSRGDHGYYTKPDISAALALFFSGGTTNYLDRNAEDPLTLGEALDFFAHEGRILFFNEAGEKVVITRDPT